MAEDSVSKESCNRSHLALDKEFSNVGKRLDSHSGAINSMQELLVRLTTLQEIAMKNQEKQNEALAKIDNRILDRTSEREEREGEIRKDKEAKFWQSTLGEWVIKAGVVFFGLILLVALNQSTDFLDKIIGK